MKTEARVQTLFAQLNSPLPKNTSRCFLGSQGEGGLGDSAAAARGHRAPEAAAAAQPGRPRGRARTEPGLAPAPGKPRLRSSARTARPRLCFVSFLGNVLAGFIELAVCRCCRGACIRGFKIRRGLRCAHQAGHVRKH